MKKPMSISLVILSSMTAIIAQAQAASWSWNDSRDLIIGGIVVPETDVIASTTVAIVTQSAQGTSLCSGSIIANDLIVTAGHCVGPSRSQMRVVFRKDLSDTSGKIVKVAGYVRDPDYGQGQNDQDQDDIALIRFKGGLPEGYAAADLLTDNSALQNGVTVTLAGYGITDGSADARDGGGGNDGAGILRKVETTISQASYGQTEVAVDQTQGKGACHGDSGGPAFVEGEDGNLQLFGVTSRGPSDSPDTCASIGIYSNILAHLDFIQAATDELRAGGSD